MPRKPTEDELRIINEYYAKTQLSADEVRIIDVRAAQAGVQTVYFSFLTPKSISNFVMDVNGKMRNSQAPTLGYYLNHNVYTRLPMGGLFDAHEEGEEKALEFHHKVFLPKGYSNGGIFVDDYLRSVELGMSEQVSVGFISNKLTCRLCQQDIRSSKCPHWPGVRYNVGTEEDPKFEICTYDVDDARLNEVSAAWQGALPGSRILTAGDDESNMGLKISLARIKDFPEDAYLKFNCSGEGSIELLGDFDVEDLNSNGGILMNTAKKPESEVETPKTEDLSKPESQSAIEQNAPEPELQKLKDRNLVLEAEAASLTTKVVALEQRLSETQRAHDEQKAIADAYLSEIHSEIHKLSVGIDATAYDKDALTARLDKFCLDELRAHRSELRKRLSGVVPTGRSARDNEETSSAPRLENYIDKSCFKTGR